MTEKKKRFLSLSVKPLFVLLLGLVLGVGAKLFTIAGPVIVYGTLAAVVYGAVLWLKGLLPV